MSEVKEDEVKELEQAMTAYCKANDRKFPSWTEVFEVLRSLGYRRPESSRSPNLEGDEVPLIPPERRRRGPRIPTVSRNPE